MKSNNFSFSNIVSVCLLLISLTAAFFAVSRTFRVKAVAKAEANASVDVQKRYVTKNIEDIRIGERTLGTNPQGRVDDELDDSIFETIPFCKYSLRTAKEDGSLCDIQLLRPANWLDDEITRLRRKIDGKVVDEVDLLADSLLLGELNSPDNYALDVWLELPEMGVVGWATLTNVDENVDVQNGAGNVVTGTFAHIADNAIDLVVEDQAEPIGCTDNHPFWSVDRHDFIPAGELIEGERLLLYNGETKRVVQKLPRPGPQVVYNLEVYGEHVYNITSEGVLVHNNCFPRANSRTSPLPNHGYVIFDRAESDQSLRILKFGVSSSPIGADGLSSRVRNQVRRYNRKGKDSEGIILKRFNNRQEALEWENKIVGLFRAIGFELNYNILPGGKKAPPLGEYFDLFPIEIDQVL